MCLFSAPSAAAAQTPPPVPELPKDPPKYADEAVKTARKSAISRAMAMQGIGGTNFTSALGVPDIASTAKMQLGA